MKREKNDKLVFLLLTHKINNTVLERYSTLKKAIKKEGDLFLLYHEKNVPGRKKIPESISAYCFNYAMLNELGYKPIAESIVPGSAHFALLQFFKDYSRYQYYWVIEYDVVFTGKWKMFFNTFKPIEADLLASHVERYAQWPNWDWWYTLDFVNLPIKEQKYVKSFNPIYRISNRALELLNKVLLEGNSGHYEALIPTILDYYNYKIIDFGGKGEFVLNGMEDSFYLGSVYDAEYDTMRFRPVYKEDELTFANKLYHPVKSGKTK